ncbi:phosphatase PAP2 family protein [Halobacteriovorax sp. HLS]|uniref:phosphatase PAP2 family protein n=1 Tax=Halobacteriovorax sp. HLS TaxID=2234000 RepID=UPI000FD76147|nr:phosphatase PAP2 family protein [Halobacteriovorax sp. HLS]
MTTFVIVYGLCNHYASLQQNHYKLYFDWELSIPHIPLMMLAYRSLDILLCSVLFLLSKETMKQYAKAMIFSVVVAAPIFIIFPAKLGFPRPEVHEYFQVLYDILYKIDKPHNLLPSMHVVYASIGLFAINFENAFSKGVVLFTSVWLMLICASVVLVHQHHILDIPTGLGLGYLSYRIFIKKNLVKE